MAKRLTLDDRLAELDALRTSPKSDTSAITLRHALGLKNSFIVARAAELVGEYELSELSDALVSAFDRLIGEGHEKDKGCRAKAVLVESLQLLGVPEAQVYLQGARHIQMEPVWGGRVDTAGSLRSASAVGLVRMNHHESLLVLADLLADPLAPVRGDAARTLAYRGSADGLALLRMRVQIGEGDSNALTECVLAMLQLDAQASMDLVHAMFNGPDPIVSESTALAMGQSRLPVAFDVLRSWWMNCEVREMCKTLMLAIAMLRRDEATEFLVSTIGQGKCTEARDAVDALAIYRHDESILKRVLDATDSSESKDLRPYAEKVFCQPPDNRK